MKDITIEGPVPGNWFVVAFKNWTNPNNDRIEQQGLFKSCITKLKADLYIKQINPIQLLPGVIEHLLYINENSSTTHFSIFIPEGVDNSTISIQIVRSSTNRPLLNIFIKPRGIPSSRNYLDMFQMEPDRNEMDYEFHIHVNAMHYITIEPNITNESFEIEYALRVDFDVKQEFQTENDYGYEVTKFQNIEFFKTFRKNHRDFFLFDVDVSDTNGTSPEYFNFSSGVNYGFRFNIFDTQDIGGMLTAIIGLITTKDSLYKRKINEKITDGPETIYDQNSIPIPEKLVDLVSDSAKSNLTVIKYAIICLHLNEPGIPEWPSHCKYGNTTLDAAALVNSSNSSQSINVPFPEAGEWFLTAKLFCISSTQNVSIKSINKESLKDEVTECNGTFVFGIGSVPCEFSQCGPHGSCYHYMSGGFVYTTCVCRNGYRGWDCTDDHDVSSLSLILFSTLLLTLSNLLFIPSVYFAFRRKYYTESLIYFFTMLFSSFYHACDSGEDIYSFCLVRLGVLQFCDFYCGLLAIWVTLIAMANIRQQYISVAHMLGAILLAFGTEYDKQSLAVFLAPALTGICIISACWAYRCKSKKMYPSKKYLAIYLPIGGVLVILGLICYAYLQTKQNYHIIHSVWHMVMAISILCLLPNKNTFQPK